MLRVRELIEKLQTFHPEQHIVVRVEGEEDLLSIQEVFAWEPQIEPLEDWPVEIVVGE